MKAPVSDGSAAGYVTNITGEKVSASKVADMTLAMEMAIKDLLGGLKYFLKETQIQRFDKQVLEEAIPVLAYFTIVLKNNS